MRKAFILQIVAFFSLATVSLTALLLWPMPRIGYASNYITGEVVSIDVGSDAERVGIQVGDKILEVYGYAWKDAYKRIFMTPVGMDDIKDIPVKIERNGYIYEYILNPVITDITIQTNKAIWIAISLCCLISGILLGTLRQGDNNNFYFSLFWIISGGIVSLYFYTNTMSVILNIIISIFIYLFMIPLFVLTCYVSFGLYLKKPNIRSKYYFIIYFCLGILAIFLSYILSENIVEMKDIMGFFIPILFSLSFINIGIYLFDMKEVTNIAYVRRKAKIISVICLFTGISWILLRIIPSIIWNTVQFSDIYYDFILMLIPLAFVFGGGFKDNYYIEKFVDNILKHLLTFVVLFVMASVIVRMLNISDSYSGIFISLCVIILYRPVFILWKSTWRNTNLLNIVPVQRELGSTLETNKIIKVFAEGIQDLFDKPGIAVYLLDEQDSYSCCYNISLDVPENIKISLVQGGQKAKMISQTSEVVSGESSISLKSDSLQNTQFSNVALWCFIYNDNLLTGVTMIGNKPNFDMYRREDEIEIEKLVISTQMSLKNSMSYERLMASEENNKMLYQRLDQIQRDTSMKIAKEIHDEILNVNVRLNIDSLSYILQSVDNPRVCEEVQRVLDSEVSVASMLREVCDRIYPSDMDDPLGLPGLIRSQVHKVAGTWRGSIDVHVFGCVNSVGLNTQRIVSRVVREAMVNAIKHAKYANAINIHLEYQASQLIIVVSDNGANTKSVSVKDGHFGLRSMYEDIHSIGGNLRIDTTDSGVSVKIRVAYPDSLPMLSQNMASS